jgi:pimeloyl-ACP methyl ester carboxylesterase
MHHVRRGSGRPLLLIHGLGGSHASWETITARLEAEREVIAVDLPGFGQTPPLAGPPSIAALADALEGFLDDEGLDGVDVAGSSMGARLALELARRGRVGAAVALDPGGFWTRREARVFGVSVRLSIVLIRRLGRLLAPLVGNRVTRTLLLAQFSAAPWRLDAGSCCASCAATPAPRRSTPCSTSSPTAPGRPACAAGTARGPIVLGWGRRDLVTLPRQAARAAALFPDAEVVWFERSGHFPQWDAPQETVRTVLMTTGGRLPSRRDDTPPGQAAASTSGTGGTATSSGSSSSAATRSRSRRRNASTQAGSNWLPASARRTSSASSSERPDR